MLPSPTPATVVAPSGVRWVVAGGEVVVWVAAVSATHVLDPAAAVLWQCLDGISTLDEIFDDMAAAYAVSRDVVASDCLPVVGSWLAAGIVTDRADVDATDDPVAAPPATTDAHGRSWRRLVDPPST